jgi:hypothetical protein
MHGVLEPLCDRLDLFAQSMGTVGASMAIVEAVMAVPLNEQTAPALDVRAEGSDAISERPPDPDVEDTLPTPDSAPVEDTPDDDTPDDDMPDDDMADDDMADDDMPDEDTPVGSEE